MNLFKTTHTRRTALAANTRRLKLTNCKRRLALAGASFLLLISSSCKTGEQAASGQLVDTWEAYDAFNRVYLDSTKYIYKNTNRDQAATDRWNGAAAIWCQPMYVDMAMNASALATKEGDEKRAALYSDLARNLLEGNIKHYAGFDFDDSNTTTGWFIYDDIQWWTITLARAAKFFNDDRYRQLAEESFSRVWYGSPKVGDTGSYADEAKELGGGMFWQWQPLENPNANRPGDGKMSCINFPTVVAAMLLHELTPENREADANPEKWSNAYGNFVRPKYETKQRYLDMAKEIYDWSVKNLADSTTGMIHDNRHGENVGGHPLIYNQGTFIGGSMLLYKATGDQRYHNLARKGADYSIDTMSPEGYLPWAHNPNNPYDQGSLEQGIYPAIWAQYVRMLADAEGDTCRYVTFINKNIEEGWKNRNAEGICDGVAQTLTPSDTLIGSYAASSTPALMLLFTPSGK